MLRTDKKVEKKKEELLPKEAQPGASPERIWATIELKIPTVQYGGITLSAGYASDVQFDETVQTAFKRTWETLRTEVLREQAEIRKQYPR